MLASQSFGVQLFHSHSLWKPRQLCLSWQTVRFLRAINKDLPSNRGIKFKPFKCEMFFFPPIFWFLSLFIQSYKHWSYCTPEVLLKGAETIKMGEFFTGNVQRYFTTPPLKGNESSFKLFIMPQRATGGPSLPHIDHTYSLNISCHA